MPVVGQHAICLYPRPRCRKQSPVGLPSLPNISQGTWLQDALLKRSTALKCFLYNACICPVACLRTYETRRPATQERCDGLAESQATSVCLPPASWRGPRPGRRPGQTPRSKFSAPSAFKPAPRTHTSDPTAASMADPSSEHRASKGSRPWRFGPSPVLPVDTRISLCRAQIGLRVVSNGEDFHAL